MRRIDFIKDKLPYLVIESGCLAGMILVMKAAGMQRGFILLILITMCLGTIVRSGLEYTKKKKYYEELFQTLESMPKKQFIAQVMEPADFLEGQYLQEVVRQTTKAMNDEIAMYQRKQQEYQEYIETWIHEVKLPIASISLLCDNASYEDAARIKAPLKRIENYVEQALYYAKSTNMERDYRVQKIELSQVVKSYLKGHASELIGGHAEIKLGALGFEVYTDPKWLAFILNQICSNSMKYRNDALRIHFYAEEKEHNILLHIADTGAGIEKADLPYVLEKGYTGSNGRKYGKSTGIGLYLCKKLCDKMNHGLMIASEKDIGTTVSIAFPKNYYYMVEKDMQ